MTEWKEPDYSGLIEPTADERIDAAEAALDRKRELAAAREKIAEMRRQRDAAIDRTLVSDDKNGDEA